MLLFKQINCCSTFNIYCKRCKKIVPVRDYELNFKDNCFRG